MVDSHYIEFQARECYERGTSTKNLDALLATSYTC